MRIYSRAWLAELHALTDVELIALRGMIREEQEHRERTTAQTEDIERRRASIAAGKGDPGPRRNA